MWTRRGVLVLLTTSLLGFSEASLASGPAETTTGAVHGIVTARRAGLEIPKVSVTLRSSTNGSLVRVGATDPKGLFRFDAVPAGRYSLEATHPGFAGVKVESVLVVEGSVRREHLTLPEKPSGPSEQS